MRKKILTVLILCFTGLISYGQNKQEKKESISEEIEFTKSVTKSYELYKPNNNIKAVLILFGGYPEVAEDIKREFKIIDIALKNNVAVVLSNFNQKLWLEENEKYQLAKKLQSIIVEHKLPNNVFIGGFSSGGVVSLLISNFIIGMKQFYIDPKGVFIIDSPIDLVGIYNASEKDVKRNFSGTSIEESIWLLEMFRDKFGDPIENIEKYEYNAVFTFHTNNTNNLKKLKNTKIRLYTEPDTLWWKKNRMTDYDQTNAFFIQKLSESLKLKGYDKVEYIPTINKGYRANGERHPHSWNIVNKDDLIKWILKK